MQAPVLIEPLPDRPGYVARVGEPFQMTVEAATPEEAVRQLTTLLHRRLQAGARVVSIPIPTAAAGFGGWLPEDELTREWLDAVQEYRQEGDEADRQRLLNDPENGQVA